MLDWALYCGDRGWGVRNFTKTVGRTPMGNRMNRRKFIVSAGSVIAGPVAALAQQAKRVKRIGFLRVGPPPAAFIDGFRRGLREEGLVEGQHFVIEYSLAPSAPQVPDAAAELVRRGVDIVVASGTPSVLPARDAAGQLPVVFVATFDPVATGLVASLAKPGRNVTGLTSISGDIIAKRVQLIKELLPSVTTIALLVRESSPTATQYVQESQNAARELRIELQILREHGPEDIDKMIGALSGASVLLITDDAEFTARRVHIAELALRRQLPTVSGFREMVEAGGLMAYGASFGELYRRAASHVRKILEGAKPADLPVEQPTKFELALNVRTAKALGLTISPSLLALADVVIE
jgi:putative ABC transport system substrate-binding protein